MRFESDPFCVNCEFELTGALICFNDERCERHQKDFEEMLESEWYKELVRLMHED